MHLKELKANHTKRRGVSKSKFRDSAKQICTLIVSTIVPHPSPKDELDESARDSCVVLTHSSHVCPEFMSAPCLVLIAHSMSTLTWVDVLSMSSVHCLQHVRSVQG